MFNEDVFIKALAVQWKNGKACLTALPCSRAVYASAILAFRNWQFSINPPLGVVYRLDIMIGMPEVIKNTAVSNFHYFLSSPVQSDMFDLTTDEGQNGPD